MGWSAALRTGAFEWEGATVNVLRGGVRAGHGGGCDIGCGQSLALVWGARDHDVRRGQNKMVEILKYWKRKKEERYVIRSGGAKGGVRTLGRLCHVAGD